MVLSNAETICAVIQKGHPEEYRKVFGYKKAIALFMADWCSICVDQMRDLTIDPQFADFLKSNEINGVYVDVDLVPELVQTHQVYGYPQIIGYRQGIEDRRVAGFMPRTELMDRLQDWFK